MTDKEFIAIMRANGYVNVCKLPNGEFIGMMRMIYTTELFVGLTVDGYRGRYCYEHAADVKKALLTWDGNGDPPGPWIKYKDGYGERVNPRMKHEFDSNPTTIRADSNVSM